MGGAVVSVVHGTLETLPETVQTILAGAGPVVALFAVRHVVVPTVAKWAGVYDRGLRRWAQTVGQLTLDAGFWQPIAHIPAGREPRYDLCPPWLRREIDTQRLALTDEQAEATVTDERYRYRVRFEQATHNDYTVRVHRKHRPRRLHEG